MTVCNMSIEGGARVGYVNPDETTFEYLRGRPFAPAGDAFDRAVALVAQRWRPIADAAYDDVVTHRRRRRSSRRSRGASTPASRSPSTSRCRGPPSVPDDERAGIDEALAFMGFRAGEPIAGTRDRRRVHRLVHQRAALGSARGGARRATASTSRRTCGRWSCPDRRRVPRRGRARGPRRDLPRGRLRVARRRLLDVPGDEPRRARRPRDLRVVVEPQLQGPAGQSRPAARC